MLRQLCSVFLVFAIGCGSETNIGADILPVPSEQPLELDNQVLTDTIFQVQPPVVDVAWVVDNSCSMSCVVSCHTTSTVDNITENFPLFMQHFKDSGVDYHIGVVTADMDNPGDAGRLQRGLGTDLWIDPTTQNDIISFTNMATQGTSGSGTEKGLAAFFNAHEEHGDTHNAGFFRDNSRLETIVLSNEDDNSGISVNEFINWYGALRSPDKVKFNSIVCMRFEGADENGNSPCEERLVEVGHDYMEVSRQVGGLIWHIMDERWGRLLDSLGAQAAGLTSEYYLTNVPVESTLVVGVTDGNTDVYTEYPRVEIDSEEVGYFYSPIRNSVLFVNYLPSPLSRIELTYTPRSSNFQDIE